MIRMRGDSARERGKRGAERGAHSGRKRGAGAERRERGAEIREERVAESRDERESLSEIAMQERESSDFLDGTVQVKRRRPTCAGRFLSCTCRRSDFLIYYYSSRVQFLILGLKWLSLLFSSCPVLAQLRPLSFSAHLTHPLFSFFVPLRPATTVSVSSSSLVLPKIASLLFFLFKSHPTRFPPLFCAFFPGPILTRGLLSSLQHLTFCYCFFFFPSSATPSSFSTSFTFG